MTRTLFLALLVAQSASAQPSPDPTSPSPSPATPPPDEPTPPDEPASDQPPAPTERTYTPLTPATPPPPAPPPAPSPAKPAITDEEESPPKLSLPTEEDRQAWQRAGFRLELGLTYGEFHGLRGAPSGRLLGPKLRIGLRLDADWSLIASFEYASANRTGGLASGLRFAGTLDPTWHVTRSLALAVGFGFGGIVEGGARTENEPTGLGVDQIETSYTFPDASHPIASCSGAGAAGLVRGEYSYVLGPRAALKVALEAIGQWTLCTDDSGRFEPDTGKAIERHQYWPHVGGTMTVGIMWR